MLGGFNLTSSQEMGIVTAGHEHAPFLAQAWNPEWIPALLEENGLQPVFPMTTWRLDLDRFDPDVLLGEGQQKLLAEGLSVRVARRRDLRRWLQFTRDLLNDSFSANPHFVPLTAEEFDVQAEAMRRIQDPRISQMAFHGGEPCGVVVALPDVNPLLRSTGSRMRWSTPLHYLRYRRRRTRASIIFGGVDPLWQNRGVVGLLLHHCTSSMKRAGYREVGITWVSDANGPSLRQMEKLGAEPLHRLSLYRRAL